MSFDAASDSRLLRRLRNCLLDAVNDEPGCRVICDGIGQDTADITLEVDGEPFNYDRAAERNLVGTWVRRFLIKAAGTQGPSVLDAPRLTRACSGEPL